MARSRRKRQYGLFEVTRLPDGSKTYQRLYDTLAFRKEQAVRFWAGRLTKAFGGGTCLRVVS